MIDTTLTIIGLIMYFIKYRKFMDKSEEEIKNYQLMTLKDLFKYSERLPYYSKLYEKHEFDPQVDFNTLSDIEKLPVLTKDSVRMNQKDIINYSLLPLSLKFRTSGTTGTPIDTYISYNHWIVEQAVIWRHWFKAGYKIFDHIAIIRSHNPKDGEEIIKKNSLKNWTYYSPYHLTQKNMENYYRDMLLKRTKFLRGYPSSLAIFAEYCHKNGYTLPRLKACLTASEVLSDAERNLIEKTFNVQVYDHYGLAEPTIMLHNHGTEKSYINCPEYGYLELLPTSNQDVYRIIGTNLHNHTMPLLRYDTGDLAIASKNNKGYLQIRSIIGRKDTNIVADGKNIPTVNIYTLMYHAKGILQWQIIQNDTSSLDIYVSISDDQSMSQIIEELNSLNITGLEFRYHETKSFKLAGEGKIIPFISNVI
jgi:phenylacetate-CoA ligase